MANKFFSENSDLKHPDPGDAPKTTPGVTAKEPQKSSPSPPGYPKIYNKVKAHVKSEGI